MMAYWFTVFISRIAIAAGSFVLVYRMIRDKVTAANSGHGYWRRFCVALSKTLRTAAFFPLIVCCQTNTRPSFEVAEVKPSLSGNNMSGQSLPSGALNLRAVTLRLLIAGAWRLRDYAVIGGPEWVGSDRFDVIAKASPGYTAESLRLMLQDLLVDRFKLSIHDEQRVLPVYVMIPGKKGPRLEPAKDDATAKVGCYGGRESGEARRQCHSVSMESFAQILPGLAPHYIDLPVVNQTGLSGPFDFEVRWTPQQIMRASGGAKDGTKAGPPVGTSIFDALEAELGLKLVRRKEATPVVVIDRAERPSLEN
jgi:uncharacterized protein (TIGR03435 family)